jgi:2-polyprenyl-3-methyl-5-hydroxy-6-metoxy-1,4-benzoquinol methylase
VYVPLLRTRERVVDLGCGRGELLDLLAEAGVPASGIDVDAAMVTRCREKGHAVEQVDALSFLRAQPDASLPALFSAHVVEHLKQDDLLSFLCLSRQKLQPGGLLIFETVNPHCLEAFKAFYTDRTHDSPIFPEVAIVLCWLTGFGEAYVRYPIGTGDPAVDRRTSGAYAVVATSAAG